MNVVQEGENYQPGLNVFWHKGPGFVWLRDDIKYRLRIRFWPFKIFYERCFRPVGERGGLY